ncbi:MAG: hypothetical protein FJ280_14685 [Planctomycetes bacterium]|nr:hypothetical protein [Planctomycetota bacterium]
METSKSPRKVLVAAYELAQQFLPAYSGKFSRQDFTLPQLFACLVLREHQNKSYRGVEAPRKDCPDWQAALGMKRGPDHNTLWRAFGHLVKVGLVNRMLDQMAVWAKCRGLIQGRIKPVARGGSRELLLRVITHNVMILTVT